MVHGVSASGPAISNVTESIVNFEGPSTPKT